MTSIAPSLSPLPEDAAPFDCGVVIVTYNSGADLPGLLTSLAVACDGLNTHVVVVDNASRDDSVAVARAHGATCIEVGANVGYAAAINIGREHVGACEALLILNPDAQLEPRSVKRLLGALHDPSIGVAVPRLVNPDGTTVTSLRREPSVGRALGDAVFGGRWPSRSGRISEIVRESRVYDRPCDADWAQGAALAVSQRCDAVLGPWNEEFFLYSEEVEFAARVRDAGFRVRYIPDAVVMHRGGGSGQSDQLVALVAVNRARYYRARHGRMAAALFTAAVILHEVLRSSESAHRASLRAVLTRQGPSELLGLEGGT
jgi:N-acetylglucosaminyl-diphospho-decaprenol L-rhamnosyltransferase